MTPVLLLDVVGLTAARPLADAAPARARGRRATARLGTVLPAVTCSVQSTMLTGLAPAQHGIVGNGWYFRDLGEVNLWRQHNALVQGEKVWETARRARPGFTAANVCWWYAMGATTDLTVTPAADVPRRRAQVPRRLHAAARAARPARRRASASSPSSTSGGRRRRSRRRAGSSRPPARSCASSASDLVMAYLPHLDYDLQRFGPDAPEADRAAAELDAVLAPLLDDARARGRDRHRRRGVRHRRAPTSRSTSTAPCARAGLLEVHEQHGPRAARPDDLARVRRRRPPGRPRLRRATPPTCTRVRDLLRGAPRRRRGARPGAQARYGLDHPRSGELVVVAEPGAWFTYYYWLDDDRAPEFARGVDIHRKPGYDPAELFFDPADPLAKARRPRPRAQEARLPVRDERRAARPDPRARHPRAPARHRRGHPAPHQLGCRAAVLGRRQPSWCPPPACATSCSGRPRAGPPAECGRARGAPDLATMRDRHRSSSRSCSSTTPAPRSARSTRPSCTARTPRCTSRSRATASTPTGGCC